MRHFSTQNVFDSQASLTSILALIKGDLISIPHFLFWPIFVTILSRLAPKYFFFWTPKDNLYSAKCDVQTIPQCGNVPPKIQWL